MKYVILLALLGAALAAPQAQRSKYADIVNIRSENDNKEDGTFSWAYENSDGTQHRQNGYIKNPNEPDPEKRIQVIEGAFSYASPEGEPISLTYVADDQGFNAQGAHLPTPPPIPEAIQKALEIIYRNAASQTQNQRG